MGALPHFFRRFCRKSVCEKLLIGISEKTMDGDGNVGPTTPCGQIKMIFSCQFSDNSY
jgi:hypothetical protein